MVGLIQYKDSLQVPVNTKIEVFLIRESKAMLWVKIRRGTCYVSNDFRKINLNIKKIPIPMTYKEDRSLGFKSFQTLTLRENVISIIIILTVLNRSYKINKVLFVANFLIGIMFW